MLVADTYLGHRDTIDVDVEGADVLQVALSDTERRRSRVRTTSANGTDLGIVVGRELRDGDVLEASERLVEISLESITALVLDLGDVTDAMAALTLGHAAGNLHWNIAVDGDRAYFQTTEPTERMEAEIRPHLPSGATIAHDEVSPATFDDGGPGHMHSHSDDHDRRPAGHPHTHPPGESR